MANQLGADEDVDVDVEAERRLQSFTLGLKQQADALLMDDKFDEAIRLYRGLLVHLTRSQVKMAAQKDLVISCRMNVIAALSKLEQWREIPGECEQVLAFLNEIKDELRQTVDAERLQAMDAQILGRLSYFRGFALFRLGAYAQADQDLRGAIQMLPNVDAIKEDWKMLQGAIQLENKVKEMLNVAMTHFQANEFALAAEHCEAALSEAVKLQKDDFTGMIHGNLAATYIKAGKDAEAATNYAAAIKYAKKLEDPQQNDRIFDLMDGLTTCYMRQKDLESAFRVLNESVEIFSQCPGRQDREHGHFMNCGRVCYALGKFADGEKHFARAEKAAMRAKDVGNALHSMVWLGNGYMEQKELDKLAALLERAFPIIAAEKNEEMYLKFALLWISQMEERSKEHAIPEREYPRLWEVYQFFLQKRHLQGHLRAVHLIAVTWNDAVPGALQARRHDVLAGLDALPVKGVTGMEAELFVRLVLVRADACVQRTELVAAQAAMQNAYDCVHDDPSNQTIRNVLLVRFAEVHCLVLSSAAPTNVDAGKMEMLERALRLLETGDKQVNAPLRSAVMSRVAQWEARKPGGDVVRAQSMLEESIALRRSFEGDSKSEQLGEALVGLCVLQLKRGNIDGARSLMQEIETFECAAEWPQLAVIKDQLRSKEVSQPATAKASSKPQTEVDAPATTVKKQPEAAKPAAAVPVEEPATESTTTTELAPRTAFQMWWDEWWFAISVVLVAIVFGFLMLQEE